MASWAPSRCVQGHANGWFSVRHTLKGGRATLNDTGDGQVCFHSWNVTADCPERLVNCTLGSPSVMPDVCLTRLTTAKSLADVLRFHFVTVLLALLTSTSIFAPACASCSVDVVSSLPQHWAEVLAHFSKMRDVDEHILDCFQADRNNGYCSDMQKKSQLIPESHLL